MKLADFVGNAAIGAHLQMRHVQKSELEIQSERIDPELIDHARRRGSQKRGGGAITLELDAAGDVAAPAPSCEILALNDALDELARVDRRKCEVIELRYFGGCTEDETARVLALSPATVRRDMRSAEAWLSTRLHSAG